MPEPTTLEQRPAHTITILGGLVATVLISALLYVAPAFGLPLIDLPLLVGGIFTGNAAVALWIGYVIFFVGGVFVATSLLATVWPDLPGTGLGFGVAAFKGLLWGLILWILSGLILPVLGLFNRLPPGELSAPGVFALGLGISGALALLLGHLVYGVVVAVVAAMGQGISPIQVLGWEGYEAGIVPESAPERSRAPRE